MKEEYASLYATHANVDALCQAIADFKSSHSDYAIPEGAAMKCIQASGEFIDFLLDLGILSSKLNRSLPWEVLEVAVVDGVSHHVARVGPLLIDWTARQFDAKADWPEITLY